MRAAWKAGLMAVNSAAWKAVMKVARRAASKVEH